MSRAEPGQPLLDVSDLEGIVHDLRGPLRGVMLYVGMLEEDATNPSHLARIRSRAQDLDRMLQAMHELGRLTNRELELETVDLRTATLAAWDRSGDPAAMDIHFDVEGSVLADPEVLGTILDEVLSNAHIHREGERGCLEWRTRVAPMGIALTLADDGPGIPSAIMERIARPFQTSKRELGHLGMGLARSRLLLRSMGGTLRVSNQQSGGAAVTLIIPASPHILA